MIRNKYISLLAFIIVTFAASAIGSFSTRIYKEPWYSSINKSSFNPPDWVFAPVWTTLYLFMTIAIWLAWNKNRKNLNIVLIYLIHLLFNTTWSIVFFVFHNILLSFLNLIVLILFIVILTIKFKHISMVSYYLMIPYLLWSFYALILNGTLLYLN